MIGRNSELSLKTHREGAIEEGKEPADEGRRANPVNAHPPLGNSSHLNPCSSMILYGTMALARKSIIRERQIRRAEAELLCAQHSGGARLQ
jgi:hypothetical protein